MAEHMIRRRREFWRNVYEDASRIGADFTSPDVADLVAHDLRRKFGPRAYRLHIKLKRTSLCASAKPSG